MSKDAPDFLRVDEILRIHEDQIERYGGSADLRDAGLLISAVEMPRATFDSTPLHADLFEMAAAYLFHIVQNHPFVDGNKADGSRRGDRLLELNGVEIKVDDDALVELVLSVAKSEVAKAEIATFLRRHAQ